MYDEQNSETIKGSTTLTSSQFDDLLSFISDVQEPRQSLGAYLFQLRTGIAIREVAFLFGMTKSTFSDRARKIRDQLSNKFVPLNSGFEAMRDREETFSHHTTIVNERFLFTITD